MSNEALLIIGVITYLVFTVVMAAIVHSAPQESDMDEEIYDPDCYACERAQQDYAELERVTDDLAALVRQLARSLRKTAPDNELAYKALDYLKRKGLQGSPLRHNA